MLPSIFNFKDMLRLNKFVVTTDPSLNEVLSETKAEPIPIEAETILDPADLETEAEVATDIFNKMVEIGIITEIALEPLSKAEGTYIDLTTDEKILLSEAIEEQK